MLLLGVIDWGSVIGAAISIIPATVAAFYSLQVRRQIRTPSGMPLGEVAEKAHHLGIANNGLIGLVLKNGHTTAEPALSPDGHLVVPVDSDLPKPPFPAS